MSRGMRARLICGAVAGPMFVFVVLVQSYTVPGFDPRLDHMSLLSLGPWGFVQIANFALCGILNLVYAQGLWRLLHGGPSGTFAPILIAIYGLGLVTVGVFTTDPARGFPPGSFPPATPSWHGAIHALIAIPVFVGDAAALAVMARYFISRHEPGWAVYVAVSSLLMLVFFFMSFTSTVLFARFLDLGVLVGWLGAAVVAIKLLNSSAVVAPTRASAT
jgi:uncharacterized protein DUF998